MDSLEDPRLDPYRDLHHRSSTARGRRFIAEGRLIVERLLASDYECESVLVEAGRHRRLVETLDPSIELLVAAPDTLRKLVGYDFHRGVLACGVRPPMLGIESLPPPSGRAASLMIACGVTDAENLGSMIRSAAAFGVDSLVITPDTADPLSRRVLRVSMAAALKIAVYTAADPVHDFQRLVRERNYRIVATTLSEDAYPLADFLSDERPLALLLGNEAEGLPDPILRVATDRVTIPMRQDVDSLNVAVAAGITLYTLFSQPR